MKHSDSLLPIALSAAVALIASLVAIMFTSDIGTLMYLVAIVILGMLSGIVALLLAIVLRRGWKEVMMLVAVFGAFLIATSLIFVSQYHIRPHLRWLIWSQRYKSEVLATAPRSGELKHVEWDGDGWGSGATGDWMGYVVFDPTDSLSVETKSGVPADYNGIPCKVILVRHLEQHWYSVVLDMNQFWDKMHWTASYFHIAVDKSPYRN